MRKINDFSATKIYTTMTAAALIIFGLICFFVVIPHDLKKEVDNSQLADLQYWSGLHPEVRALIQERLRTNGKIAVRDYRDAGQLSSELTHKNLVDSFRKD
jgi:hypothetical protein